MKIADLHADIGYDCMQKKKKGFQGNVLSKYHVEHWKASGIQLVCMACYFDEHATWEDMQAMIQNLYHQIMNCPEVQLVKSRQDLHRCTHQIKAIMSVEGMHGVDKNVSSCIQWMYDMGVRVASLCWNEENQLATGIKGDAHRGLQEKGYEAIETMKQLGMIMDVSHANDQTFLDIMQIKNLHVMASHSNVREICQHKRNLTVKQIQQIQEKQGIVGLNAAPYFIHTKKEYQDIEHYVQHLLFLKQQLKTIRGIACGFDFMDYFENETQFTKYLQQAKDASNLIPILQSYGFTEKEMSMFLYDTVFAYFDRFLP